MDYTAWRRKIRRVCNVEILKPELQLGAFRDLEVVERGETKHVSIALPASALSYYDIVTHKFIVVPGIFDVTIGSSSVDTRLQTRLEVR